MFKTERVEITDFHRFREGDQIVSSTSGNTWVVEREVTGLKHGTFGTGTVNERIVRGLVGPMGTNEHGFTYWNEFAGHVSFTSIVPSDFTPEPTPEDHEGDVTAAYDQGYREGQKFPALPTHEELVEAIKRDTGALYGGGSVLRAVRADMAADRVLELLREVHS